MPIKVIAVISISYTSGIAFIKTLHHSTEIREILYNHGYVQLKDGTTYQVITNATQVESYEFIRYIKDPWWKNLEDVVKERVIPNGESNSKKSGKTN